MLKTAQSDGLAACERLRVPHAGRVTPAAGAVATRFDHAGDTLGLIVDELRAIAAQRGDLRLELRGDVDHDTRTLDDPQVHAEVVQDPRRMEWRPGNIGFRQFAPEARLLDELGRGGVV